MTLQGSREDTDAVRAPTQSGPGVSADAFARRLLDWYPHHGRKDLPWKRTRDPYAIWVSEIMLQQTQVSTVIPYFERFIARFPDVATLARAELDEVLECWSGLGYYARARNLHRAADVVVAHHGARLPGEFHAMRALPGVGASTAAAVLAFAFGKRHVILDGNVKRVLARYHAIADPPGARATQARLWQLADRHTPHRQVRDYTQAIMDLGATVCRRQPDCARCPVRRGCRAFAEGSPQAYPRLARARPLPLRSTAMLIISDRHGRLLLQQRPPVGLWGGLWSFPECPVDIDMVRWCRHALGLRVAVQAHWPVRRHAFTHFRLDITPVRANLTGAADRAMEGVNTVWYNPRKPDARGFAVPVKQLLAEVTKAT